jgi:putative transport protein
MDWLLNLATTNPTAHAIAILSLVCVAGMSLGSIHVRGIKLGTAGVLFAAILAGHFGKPIDHHTLEFVKEFGLILFVFCIGLQIGPGFFASLRRAGLRLNFLASAIVVVGGLTAVLLGWLFNFDRAAVPGIFSGATTNTPSLGAAQQTLASFSNVSPERAALPALAYAVTYPLGIIGIISTMLALKAMFRIDQHSCRRHIARTRSISTRRWPIERGKPGRNRWVGHLSADHCHQQFCARKNDSRNRFGATIWGCRNTRYSRRCRDDRGARTTAAIRRRAARRRTGERHRSGRRVSWRLCTCAQ